MPSNPEARAALLPLLDRANLGPFPSFDEARPTLLFNIHGGAEWTGAAADPKGFLYVTSNEIPWSITCFRDDDPAPLLPPSAGEQIYQTNCAVCHGKVGLANGIVGQYGVAAIANLQDDRIRAMPDGQLFSTITNGKNTMGAYGPQIAIEDRWAIVAYLRALQKSQGVKLADLPEAQQQELQAKP
jgi:mono/diheme cytochrome c family protein